MKKFLLFLLMLVSLGSTTHAGGPDTGEIIGDKGPVIRYYPNPIQKYLTIEVQLEYLNQFSRVEVKIVNLLGQEMVPTNFLDLNGLNNELRIDFTDVPAGVYFLEVYSFVNGNSVKQTRKITRN
ncbi:MAG: T9SS type A sorting domain-containing protein [Bacteroidetes bacterium]|nr:T9SS type A sorting domain-containing protein [Bacteroidota bacterium]